MSLVFIVCVPFARVLPSTRPLADSGWCPSDRLLWATTWASLRPVHRLLAAAEERVQSYPVSTAISLPFADAGWHSDATSLRAKGL